MVRAWLATGVSEEYKEKFIAIALEAWLKEKPRRACEPEPDDPVSDGDDFSSVEGTLERRKAALRTVLDREDLTQQEKRVVEKFGDKMELEAIRFVLHRRAEGGRRCLPRDIAWDTKKKGFQRLFTQDVINVLDAADEEDEEDDEGADRNDEEESEKEHEEHEEHEEQEEDEEHE
eukprot:Hpha_TRINITY_DN14949_c3_g3::TRINITY_DN14949_c3_g3_i1::g.144177::m.144177